MPSLARLGPGTPPEGVGSFFCPLEASEREWYSQGK